MRDRTSRLVITVLPMGAFAPSVSEARVLARRALRFGLLAVCFLCPAVARAQGTYQQYLDQWKNGSDPFEQWVFANGQKLTEFMPQPVPGVVDHLPWEAVDNYLPHFESYVHHQYLGFRVERIWALDDPQLFRQVALAQQRFDESKRKIDSPESVQRVQAQGKLQKEANDRYLKQYEELWKQGKQKEAQEVMEKRAKDPVFQPPPEYAENSQREQEVRDLQAKGQKLIIDIQASYPPSNWSLLKQAGTLKGYPLFRGVQQEVFLAVYVGPNGFRNPPAGKEPQKRQIKCFLVQAELPAGEKYEAIARRMLEEIDYSALAKLVEP